MVMEDRGRDVNNDDESAWMRKLMEEVKEKLTAAKVPTYPGIGRAARAASKLIDYYQRRRSR